MRQPWQGAWAALAAPGSPWPWISIAVLAAAPHLDVLSHPFAYDDWHSIPLNPYITRPGGIGKMFAGNVWDFLGGVGTTGAGNYYRPLMHLLNYLVYHLLGPQPGWFHLAGLALHTLISVMVAAVVRRFSGSHSVGVIAGLLFAVHPAHSEVVAWIACTPELLNMVFSLLVILLYLRATEPQAARRGRPLLLAAMGAALLAALFSKETAVLTPVILAAHEWLAGGRETTARWKRVWPEFAVLGAATLAYLVARAFALGGLMPIRRQVSLDRLDHLWTSLAIFYRYLALLVWPVNLHFFRYYQPNRSLFEPAVLAGGGCLVAFVGGGIWLCRRRRHDTLALVLFLLPLLPMFLLPYLYIGKLMTERAVYFPSVGFCWLMAIWLSGGVRGWRKAESPDEGLRFSAALLLAVLLVAYTARSAMRMADWRDEVGLFDEGLARAPAAPHLHLWRADVLMRQNRPVEAVASLRLAIALRDDYSAAHNLLGRAYWMLRQPGPALDHYRRAAELAVREDPASAARAWNNVGIVHRSEGNGAEAVAAYQRALRLDPAFAAARNNLGYALLVEGRVDEALRELRAAVSVDPALAQAHANLGLAYAMKGEYDAAIKALLQAETLSPGNAEVHARIGEVHLARGEDGPALARFHRALGIEPQNPRAASGLAHLRARGAVR